MDNTLKDQIIKDMGLADLSPAEQDEALLRIGNIIFKGVLVRAMDELDELQQENLDKLLEQNPDNADIVFAFLRGSVADFDALVADEIATFKRETQQIASAI